MYWLTQSRASRPSTRRDERAATATVVAGSAPDELADITEALARGQVDESGGLVSQREPVARARRHALRLMPFALALDPAAIPAADELRDSQAIRHTRKYHLGFLVATQEIGALSQNVFRGLHTYIFGFGLKNASEQERVKEILSDPSAWRMYEQMPEPKSSGIYQYAIQGAALPLANGAAVTIRAYGSLREFLAANAAFGLTDPGDVQLPPPGRGVSDHDVGLDGLEGLTS